MAMLPIFVIGLIVGYALGYMITVTVIKQKQETPSQVKFDLLQAEIITLKSDNEALEKCIQKKDDMLKQIKQELQKYEENK